RSGQRVDVPVHGPRRGHGRETTAAEPYLEAIGLVERPVSVAIRWKLPKLPRPSRPLFPRVILQADDLARHPHRGRDPKRVAVVEGDEGPRTSLEAEVKSLLAAQAEPQLGRFALVLRDEQVFESAVRLQVDGPNSSLLARPVDLGDQLATAQPEAAGLVEPVEPRAARRLGGRQGDSNFFAPGLENEGALGELDPLERHEQGNVHPGRQPERFAHLGEVHLKVRVAFEPNLRDKTVLVPSVVNPNLVLHRDRRRFREPGENQLLPIGPQRARGLRPLWLGSALALEPKDESRLARLDATELIKASDRGRLKPKSEKNSAAGLGGRRTELPSEWRRHVRGPEA